MTPTDIRKALHAFEGHAEFAAAGVDGAFLDAFVENLAGFPALPASTQEKIRDQFAGMAAEMSYRLGVGHGKTCPEKARAMAEWMKGVNALLTLHRFGLFTRQA